MLIDATLKHAMPPVALPGREYMERARELWERLGLPRADAADAVARLFPRILGRSMGHICPTCSCR